MAEYICLKCNKIVPGSGAKAICDKGHPAEKEQSFAMGVLMASIAVVLLWYVINETHRWFLSDSDIHPIAYGFMALLALFSVFIILKALKYRNCGMPTARLSQFHYGMASGYLVLGILVPLLWPIAAG